MITKVVEGADECRAKVKNGKEKEEKWRLRERLNGFSIYLFVVLYHNEVEGQAGTTRKSLGEVAKNNR